MYSKIVQFVTVVSVFLSVMSATVSLRPPYIDCVDTVECAKHECCSIGMGRFSIPTCRPLLEVGEGCSPDNTPRSTNVTYPDNSFVTLKNVYTNMCPCSFGLVCDKHTSSCTDPSANESFNFLEYWNA